MSDRQSASSSGDTGATPSANAAKLALRDQLLTARNRRSLLEVGEAARAIAEHVLATTEVRRAATVAAYVSIGTEPGTTALLESLVDRVTGLGKRVVLPVVQPDLDLDWSVYRGPTSLAPARMGLLEPAVRGSASTRSPPPTSCSSPALACPATATAWAVAAAATTASSPASPSAPLSGCCSTTTRSASTCRWNPTTARSPAPSRRQGSTSSPAG